MDWLWFVTVVIGPILLIGAILYATIRYWKRPKGRDAYTDAKTRELRHELEAEDARR
ncbi:hypothetical protein GCM10011371_04990 [Novosphingobium marinum]|uniref:Uncharacterized protein n=1 Tax=Novosphingobium marinum TaxID=1514948 RepID=A0A7Z0BTK5_9SPHN|nr:hypothetical protein [Novosphingobium marinum]NYH94188.1 hypothetical protein [Novosphingobium marinum]GGC20287.1 hypothetical protein GCM10011371_04990 [Novosphingobium marinum]